MPGFKGNLYKKPFRYRLPVSPPRKRTKTSSSTPNLKSPSIRTPSLLKKSFNFKISISFQTGFHTDYQPCLRGNLGKSTHKTLKNKFQHLGKRKFQVITLTTLLQIQVVCNRFWSSSTIGRPGISNTAKVTTGNNNGLL